MELFDIILTGFGSLAVTKSLLILLLQADDLMKDKYIQEKVQHYMSSYGIKNMDKATQFTAWTLNDEFDPWTIFKKENRVYNKHLDKLKEKILDFYFKSLKTIHDEENDINLACDVESTLGDYVLQLMRLRMVIEPQIQISQGVHPQSKIPYLYVKSYWIDDNGKKKRKFTKLIGRAEDYKGIKDQQALEDGLNMIQPVMWEKYQELYPT